MRLTQLLSAAILAAMSWPAQAQVFELQVPDVEKDTFVFEFNNGVVLDDVEHGDARSGHEISLGYAPVSFWRPSLALELLNPEGEDVEVEGYVFENIFVFPFGRGGDDHAEGGDHAEGDDTAEKPNLDYAVGFYGAVGVPNDEGFDHGSALFGPIGEVFVGPVDIVANFFVDMPFQNDLDPGLAYGFGASGEVGKGVSVGFESYGGVEEAFGGNAPSLDETEHYIGPAVYYEADLGHDRVLAPRLAVLFGLTEATPDATISLNIELEF